MEALLTSSADIRKEENESKALLVSGKGEIYLADLESGQIKWLHDTKEPTYNTYRARGVVEYVDIGLEDEYPYYYSRSRPTVIPPGKDMSKYIEYLFKENPDVTVHTDEFYLNFSTGKRSEEGGQDFIFITRTDFEISIPKRWSFMYSNLEVSFPSSEKSSKCLVIYARTPETFIDTCNKYRLSYLPGEGILARTINLSKRICLKEFVGSNGSTSFFLGSLRDSKVNSEVFVKRVLKTDGYLKVLNVYEKIGHSEYVTRLLSVENDDQYEYLAFEYNKEYETLADVLDLAARQKFIFTSILRHVIRGLMDLEASGVFHCNITPQHVLVRNPAYGGYAIKFCGFQCSRACTLDSELYSSSSMLARQNLGQLISNYFSYSQKYEHSRVASGVPDDFEYNPLKKNTFEVKEEAGVGDLVGKLMNKKYKMSFMEAYNHLIFWSDYDQMMFLKETSDEIFAGNLEGIEKAARTVFGDDWESKLISSGGQQWYSKMKEVPEEAAKMKEAYEESEDRKEMHKKNGGGRNGRGGKNGKAEGNKAKRPVYNPKSLRDLLILVRNGVNHRCPGVYPGDSTLELWEYLNFVFPALFTAVYNFVLNNGQHTQVYFNYCYKEL